MSTFPTTISDLKKTTAYFAFLLTIANVPITELSPPERKCLTCRKPFQKTAQNENEESINAPIKLNCGHVSHIRCLARSVFAANFINTCPQCHNQIIPDSHADGISHRSWQVVAPLLELLMLLDRDLEFSSIIKDEAVGFLRKGIERKEAGFSQGMCAHRVLVLYEEFVCLFCDRPASVRDGGPLEAAEREEEVRDLRRRLDVRGRELGVRFEREEARMKEVRDSCEEQLRCSREERDRVREAGEKWAELCVRCGMVGTLSLLGMFLQLPVGIFVRLCFVACVVPVAYVHASRISLAVLGLVVLAVLFGIFLGERGL